MSGRAATCLAVSSAVRDDAAALMPRTPVELLLNTVDVQRFAPAEADPGELDRLAGLPLADGRVLRVALVATYARWKGQDVLLRAAGKILARRRDIRFYIVGGPIYRTAGSQFSRQDLQSLAQSLGVARHVGFINFVDDPRDIYRSADICVHASTRPEPFGLTILEAMACGRPVICAEGAAELVQHGVSGLRTPPGDCIALADAITRLADDPGLRHSLATEARRRAVERFSRARLGPELLGWYERVLRSELVRSIDELDEPTQVLTDLR
jgi:glycosyltransferase involved in cell wall biosynthesis